MEATGDSGGAWAFINEPFGAPKTKGEATEVRPVLTEGRRGVDFAQSDQDILSALRHSEVRNIILSHVSIAISFGVVPVPVFDFVAITGTQLHLIRSLAQFHNRPFNEQIGRKLLMSVIGGASPLAIGTLASSLMKSFPGVGSVAGGAALAVTGGATTLAVGYVFARHFERSEEDVGSLDVKMAKQDFRKAFRASRAVVQEHINSV